MTKTRYKAPPQEDIEKAMEELPSAYTDKNNKERKAQVTLAPSLLAHLKKSKIDKNSAYDIEQGYWFFIEQVISDSYKLVPVPIPTIFTSATSFLSRFSPVSYNATNSELYRFTQKTMLLDENNKLDSPPGDPDPDPTKFNCLVAFLKYVENKNNRDHLVTDELLQQIRNVVEANRKPVAEKIDRVCKKLSPKKTIPSDFATSIKTSYKEACAKDYCSRDYWSTYLLYLMVGRKEGRLKDIEFLEAIDASLKEKNASEEERDFALKGAAVVIMARIEAEYAYTLSSPEKSELYRLLQKKTGLKRSCEFIEFTEAYLATLQKNICSAVVSEDELTFWKKQGVEKAALDKAKSDILTLQKELDQAKKGVHLSNDLRFNTIINKLFDSIASSIAGTGVVVLTAQLIASASNMSLTSLLLATSPQNTILMMTAIYAAQHLRGPLSTAVTGVIAPVIKPLILAPVNAALAYSTKPHAPTLFPSAERLTEEEYKLFVSHYYLCSPSEKEALASAVDLIKLSRITPTAKTTSNSEETYRPRGLTQ